MREGVLGVLPMTTTTDDFQRFVRDEKDKQHVHNYVHEQNRNWTTISECIMEVQDLARRQTRLGELEQIRSEKYMECEQQIRSINHIMNVTSGNQ